MRNTETLMKMVEFGHRDMQRLAEGPIGKRIGVARRNAVSRYVQTRYNVVSNIKEIDRRMERWTVY